MKRCELQEAGSQHPPEVWFEACNNESSSGHACLGELKRQKLYFYIMGVEFAYLIGCLRKRKGAIKLILSKH